MEQNHNAERDQPRAEGIAAVFEPPVALRGHGQPADGDARADKEEGELAQEEAEVQPAGRAARYGLRELRKQVVRGIPLQLAASLDSLAARDEARIAELLSTFDCRSISQCDTPK